MVDILAFYSGLAFALRDSSASLISGSTILDLVRLTLIPIILLPIVARVSRQLLTCLTLGWSLTLTIDDILSSANCVKRRSKCFYQWQNSPHS